MTPTRITVVLDVDHEPEIDVPMRAAQFLERTLGEVDGFGAVSVVRGELDAMVWTPQHGRGDGAGRHGARSAYLPRRRHKSRPPGHG